MGIGRTKSTKASVLTREMCILEQARNGIKVYTHDGAVDEELARGANFICE
jgi:hypothetical protein